MTPERRKQIEEAGYEVIDDTHDLFNMVENPVWLIKRIKVLCKELRDNYDSERLIKLYKYIEELNEHRDIIN